MTLEELQAEFPHGSRWRRNADSAPSRVIGWSEDAGGQVCTKHVMDAQVYLWSVANMRTYWNRVPDPTPCPITEPVTLRLRRDDPGYPDFWDSSPALKRDYVRGDIPAITLLPGGTYTWEGGPS